eukprot:TRINITY_DN11207_c0_g1_i1.p1 TRINITY_DN11207_c0_g1~~TRINITY_DN11207_c0_g1_i1.p1  ORF type:complete len:773 (+),score=99.23 TRINITY_DN11207_c0_g1_i1:31-2349(+)
MGALASTHQPNQPAIACIQRLVSANKVNDGPDYDLVLHYNFRHASTLAQVEQAFALAEPLCAELERNCQWSGNLLRLIKRFVLESTQHLRELDPAQSQRTSSDTAMANAMHLLRFVLNHLIHSQSEQAMLTFLEARPDQVEHVLRMYLPLLQQDLSDPLQVASPSPHLTASSHQQPSTPPLISLTSSIQGDIATNHALRPVVPTQTSIPTNTSPSTPLPATTQSRHSPKSTPSPTQSHASLHHRTRSNLLNTSSQEKLANVSTSLALIKTVTSIILQQPLTTYRLNPLLEGVSLMLTLASRQLHSPADQPGLSYLMDAWLTSDRKVLQQLWLRLMNILIETSVADSRAEEEDLVRDIAGLFYMPFQLLQSKDELTREEDAAQAWELLQTRASLLAQLLLYQPSGVRSADDNVFLAALRLSQDDAADNAGSQTTRSRKIHLTLPFAGLLDAIIRHMPKMHGALMLYHWLLHNHSFRAYCLGNALQLEQLIIVLLQHLYTLTARNLDHRAALLCSLVLLSQDSTFANILAEATVETAAWYKGRDPAGHSLCDLTYSVLLTLLGFNWHSTKDQDVHRNAFAVLINLAPYVNDLSSHCSQKLVRLLHMIAKQFCQAVMQATPSEHARKYSFVNVSRRATHACLSVINAIVANRLQQNPQLIYNMLTERDTFVMLESCQCFSPELASLLAVVRHFMSRAPEQELQQSTSRYWQRLVQLGLRDKILLGGRPIRFKFEQVAAPETYFLPMLWGCILQEGKLQPADRAYVLMADSLLLIG